MQKYKISITDLDTRHGIHKLTRDGFTREQIIREMYNKTDGMHQQERTNLVQKLYDRRDK